MSTAEVQLDGLRAQLAGRLEGDVAIVTGSTSGLGRAIARVLAAAGAAVGVTGRDTANGTALVTEIRATGGVAHFVRADVTEESDCQVLVEEIVGEFGGLSILVNNASGRRGTGSHLHALVTEMPAADWDHILRSDLAAVATMCRLSIPHMLERARGSIVNVSSSTAERAVPKTSAYTAAKGGVNALTRAITVEFARKGIRCNAVQPGYITPEGEEARAITPPVDRYLTRLSTGVDVALAVLFLAGREAETISGIILPVDCGHTAVRALAV
jgi:NAD(P)-dependent dehydrogenase (short-subunit alcohol dehydrogenase family)